jgi:pyruvate dehydrogenase (quinone)
VFAHQGPALVDPHKPASPGLATMTQAGKFAQSLLRGEKERAAIVQTLLQETVRDMN